MYAGGGADVRGRRRRCKRAEAPNVRARRRRCTRAGGGSDVTKWRRRLGARLSRCHAAPKGPSPAAAPARVVMPRPCRQRLKVSGRDVAACFVPLGNGADGRALACGCARQ
jgi:hypothetical protein